MPGPLPTADLEHVFSHTAPLWENLRGRRLFITGGTGFFGSWLLESFAFANDRLQLGAQATVLTRDPKAFEKKAPHLARRPDLRFHAGDVLDFSFRDFPIRDCHFSHIIHAATDTRAQSYAENPELMSKTILEGTRRMLEFARRCDAPKFLLTSSGAVYGAPAPHIPGPRGFPNLFDLHGIPHFPDYRDDYLSAPDPAIPASPYGNAKRTSEFRCFISALRGGLEVKIARCYAFVGPHLPLDGHFAIGNFIRDALAGGPINIQGDGTPLRSYLYAADLAIWLWKILFDGVNGRPYNVGGAKAVSIAETAAAVRDALRPECEIVIAQKAAPGKAASRFVPDVTRARTELGLETWIGLEDAIRRTAAWHKG